jgi:hypothetical protein
MTQPSQAKRASATGRGAGFSIRAAILTAIGTLAILSTGLAGWRGYNAWQSYNRAVDAQEFDAAANKLITGLFEVLMERLYTNNALQAPGPVTPAVLAEIEKRRKVVAENFTPGLEALAREEFPNKAALLEDVRRTVEKANQARQQADAAIKLPREQRDEALRKSFIPTITASVDASLKLWLSAMHAAAEVDPQLARLAAMKEIGWTMRDISGRERSNIGSAIAAGTPVPPEKTA